MCFLSVPYFPPFRTCNFLKYSNTAAIPHQKRTCLGHQMETVGMPIEGIKGNRNLFVIARNDITKSVGYRER